MTRSGTLVQIEGQEVKNFREGCKRGRDVRYSDSKYVYVVAEMMIHKVQESVVRLTRSSRAKGDEDFPSTLVANGLMIDT